MWAYILYSETIDQYYTGQCIDLEARLKRHNSGETVSIKKGIPWRLAWKQECSDRSLAMALEKKIKSRGAKRFLADLGVN